MVHESLAYIRTAVTPNTYLELTRAEAQCRLPHDFSCPSSRRFLIPAATAVRYCDLWLPRPAHPTGPGYTACSC